MNMQGNTVVSINISNFLENSDSFQKTPKNSNDQLSKNSSPNADTRANGDPASGEPGQFGLCTAMDDEPASHADPGPGTHGAPGNGPGWPRGHETAPARHVWRGATTSTRAS